MRVGILILILMTFTGTSVMALDMETTDEHVMFTQGKKPVMAYHYTNVPFKPYVEKFYTPKGVQILRDSPHDHVHHHALMYAIGVDGVSYWEESKRGGFQKHQGFENLTMKGDNVTWTGFKESIHLVKPKATAPALLEERALVVADSNALKGSLLTWQTTFTLPEGINKAELTGSHYYGLGMRFDQSMDNGGTFLNAADIEGKIVRGDEKNFQANWCAYQAEMNGKPVTVAVFDHPDNARPVTWFTMGDNSPAFAYLSATLNLQKEPMPLTAGQHMTVRYGVMLWDGRRPKEEIEEAYSWWLNHQPALDTIKK